MTSTTNSGRKNQVWREEKFPNRINPHHLVHHNLVLTQFQNMSIIQASLINQVLHLLTHQTLQNTNKKHMIIRVLMNSIPNILQRMAMDIRESNLIIIIKIKSLMDIQVHASLVSMLIVMEQNR